MTWFFAQDLTPLKSGRYLSAGVSPCLKDWEKSFSELIQVVGRMVACSLYYFLRAAVTNGNRPTGLKQ